MPVFLVHTFLCGRMVKERWLIVCVVALTVAWRDGVGYMDQQSNLFLDNASC